MSPSPNLRLLFAPVARSVRRGWLAVRVSMVVKALLGLLWALWTFGGLYVGDQAKLTATTLHHAALIGAWMLGLWGLSRVFRLPVQCGGWLLVRVAALFDLVAMVPVIVHLAQVAGTDPSRMADGSFHRAWLIVMALALFVTLAAVSIAMRQISRALGEDPHAQAAGAHALSALRVMLLVVVVGVVAVRFTGGVFVAAAVALYFLWQLTAALKRLEQALFGL